MQDHIKLSIPNPCSENWEEMTPDERGRFCQKCAKAVIDFTQLSDRELVTIISQQKGEICGRFLENQLSRPIILPKKPSLYKRYVSGRWIAALLLLQMFASDVKAQRKTAPATQNPSKPNTAKITINGVLLDFETQKPVANRKVYFNNSRLAKLDSTVTDAKGRFMLRIPASQLEGAFLSFDQSQSDKFIPDEKLEPTKGSYSNMCLYEYPIQRMPETKIIHIRPIVNVTTAGGVVTETVKQPPTFTERIKHFFKKENHKQ